MILGSIYQFFIRKPVGERRTAARSVELSLGQCCVINLAQGRGGVAVQFERLRDRYLVGIFGHFFEGWLQGINTRCGWPKTQHHRGAGWVADGSLAVGVGKQGSPRREPVEVWGLHLRMPTEATDPIIQVVNSEKENIRL